MIERTHRTELNLGPIRRRKETSKKSWTFCPWCKGMCFLPSPPMPPPPPSLFIPLLPLPSFFYSPRLQFKSQACQFPLETLPFLIFCWCVSVNCVCVPEIGVCMCVCVRVCVWERCVNVCVYGGGGGGYVYKCGHVCGCLIHFDGSLTERHDDDVTTLLFSVYNYVYRWNSTQNWQPAACLLDRMHRGNCLSFFAATPDTAAAFPQ